VKLEKAIVFFGRRCVLACDGRCDKAWGVAGRPSRKLSLRPNDDVYIGDGLLGTAPGPGDTVVTSEGGHMKPSATPITDSELLNKWCTRECERSVMAKAEEPLPPLPTFESPARKGRGKDKC